MIEILQKGFGVRTCLEGTAKVEKYFAEGEQGVIYFVDYNGKKALKWYKKTSMGQIQITLSRILWGT